MDVPSSDVKLGEYIDEQAEILDCSFLPLTVQLLQTIPKTSDHSSYAMSRHATTQLPSAPSRHMIISKPYVEYCPQTSLLFVGAMAGHWVDLEGEPITYPGSTPGYKRPPPNAISLELAHTLRSFKTEEEIKIALSEDQEGIITKLRAATSNAYSQESDIWPDQDLTETFKVQGVRLALATVVPAPRFPGWGGTLEPAWTDLPTVKFKWKETEGTRRSKGTIVVSLSAIAQGSNPTTPGTYQLRPEILQSYSVAISHIIPKFLSSEIATLADKQESSRQVASKISEIAQAQRNLMFWALDGNHVVALSDPPPKTWTSESMKLEGIEGMDLSLKVRGEFDTGEDE